MNAMKKISLNEYQNYTRYVENISFGEVYPRAVVNGMQSGEIFSDGKAVLIWHYCGFAWICGEYSDIFLREAERLKADARRRLVFFTGDERVSEFFERCGASLGKRLFFRYTGAGAETALPEGFEIKPIGRRLFEELEGRVEPKLFWSDAGEFERNGKGFCVMNGSEPAAWAFFASTDGKEADIGVEAAEKYRGRGLASAAASAVIFAAVKEGLKPVWACDSGNKASQGLARKLGFECCGECLVIR